MSLGIRETEGVPDAIHASGILVWPAPPVRTTVHTEIGCGADLMVREPYLRFTFGAGFESARALCEPVCAGETATDCACFCPLFSV